MEKMEKEALNFNELLEDLRRIRGAVKQNSYVYHQLIYTPIIKFILWVSGGAALFVPFFYYLLLERYVNYEAIPSEIRLALILVIVIGLVIVLYGKLLFILKAYQLTSQPSLSKFLNRFLSHQVLLLYPLIVGSLIFFVIFFMTQQTYHLLVPAIAIGFGLCFSVIGSFISLPEFFAFGNYCWVLGTVSIPFVVSAPLTALLWTSGIFGLGMLGLGFFLTVFNKERKEHEDGGTHGK